MTIRFSGFGLTHSCRRSVSYRNQSIDLFSKYMDWFLYDRDHRHERDNSCLVTENKAENKFNHIRKISRKTEGKFAEKGKFRERLFTSNLLEA